MYLKHMPLYEKHTANLTCSFGTPAHTGERSLHVKHKSSSMEGETLSRWELSPGPGALVAAGTGKVILPSHLGHGSWALWTGQAFTSQRVLSPLTTRTAATLCFPCLSLTLHKNAHLE